jgi:hypothetical protein
MALAEVCCNMSLASNLRLTTTVDAGSVPGALQNSNVEINRFAVGVLVQHAIWRYHRVN